MNWPHLLFGLRGRIDGAKWWIASCILIVVGAVVWKLLDWFDGEALSAALSRPVAISVAVVLALVGLLIVYCLLAVSVKRLHDRNRRGWWMLLFPMAPPVLASIVGAFGEDLAPVLTYALWAVVLIITVGGFIELGVMPGTAGLNRYGPDPRARIKGDPRQGAGS
jgi:uncharacterized membrane protein YhaH (DUF805 family)